LFDKAYKKKFIKRKSLKMNSYLLIIFITCSLVSSAQEIKFLKPLVKSQSFKDTLLDAEKIIAKKCTDWSLSQKDVIFIFKHSKIISAEKKMGQFYELPCAYRTKVEYKKDIYIMEINAASTITLYNNKRTIYFGCISNLTSKFFLMPSMKEDD